MNRSQSHSHDHVHGHSHDHSHAAAAASRKRLTIALAMTVIILLSEVVGAWLSHSLALLADAGHMFVDVLGLVFAVVASHMMMRPRTNRRTWGMARAEVLAASMQSGMLLIICLVVCVKAVESVLYPHPVHGQMMIIFGLIGLVGNSVSILVMYSGRGDNLNTRAAFLEVANDAIGSVAVVIAALLTWLTGWIYWDPVASLIIVALMAPRAWKLLRKSVSILMVNVPEGVDVAEIRRHMMEVPHVIDVHDLHVTTIATGVIALTAHVTVTDECFKDGHTIEILHQIQDCVATHFPVSIRHSTIQIDSATHRDHEMLEHDGC